jgi:DNA-directed RNA polymerase subunit RPC12/RpoP
MKMSVLSSGTGRFAQAKIEVKCVCGKRYRVSHEKAGKRLRCKKCRSKIEIPGASSDGAISMRSRKAILEELGIDADSAEQRYEEEKSQSYNCSVCSCSIDPSQLKKSYGEAGLTCAGCRADQKKEKGTKSDNALETWNRKGSPEAARRQALTKGALILVGTTCLLQFAMPIWGAALAAAVLAGAASNQIYKMELQG